MKLDQVIAKRPQKTIYRDGDSIIKLFEKDFPKSDILNEALNQARVEETGLNIPKIQAVTLIDGKWAIVMDYVEGRTLADIMEESDDAFEKNLDAFVELQMSVHGKRSPMLNKLKDKMNRKISSLDIVSATIRYDLHTRLDGMPKHTKVCHGDFNPSNIIIGKNGTAYIIDWSHATQGNAGADAARTYLLFALKDIKKADLYLNKFCEKSDMAKQYVLEWLPVVAASQLTKGVPEEKEFLLKWLDVCDWQ